MLKPFVTSTTRPDLMGPYKDSVIGSEFRERFGKYWTKSPAHPHCWLIGNDKLTISYNSHLNDFVYVERGLNDVRGILELPLEQRTGDKAFRWEELPINLTKFKYRFMCIEEALKWRDLW
ncbi:hypothetical protein D3C85_14810 [compost metagenome]